MKADIHPNYKTATVVCGCGNTFETRSTKDKIVVEICSNCHPFYTGKQKYVDTAGMVERFQRKWGTLEDRMKAQEESSSKKPGKKTLKRPKTLAGATLQSLPAQKKTEPKAKAPEPKPAEKPPEKPPEKPAEKPAPPAPDSANS